MMLKNLNLYLKTIFFKRHCRLRITKKSVGLSFNYSRSQFDLLIMRQSQKPPKKQIPKEAKTSNNLFWHGTVEGTIFMKFYLQELLIVIFPSSKSPPFKGTF